MSSPITISSSRTQTETLSAARSLDSATPIQKNLYVPVHRRNPSTSSVTSAPSFFHDHASLGLSPNQHCSQSRSPAFRARSISPLPVHARHHDVATPKSTTTTPISRTNANIPPASKIPRVYTLTELLALSSSPSVGLSPSQRAHVDAHIPFMTRKSSSTKSSPSSSPTSNPTPLVKPLDSQKKADTQRRRRSGRKAPNASLKSRVPADVEGRRRRNAYGAGWGWPAAPLDGSRNVLGFESRSESWRAERLVVAA
ncbi:hypothetical protein OH76DRAFT_1470826 [Lentinus brumalis]|uniref:Uncharacterized protein n=1 Tax=Lentinus brumalis TaxID=2498619 RepID=A0A371DGS0_9APHY|nr:hypothetical protein OH76DRAFT_1470826 [Polyporus brumalis]